MNESQPSSLVNPILLEPHVANEREKRRYENESIQKKTFKCSCKMIKILSIVTFAFGWIRFIVFIIMAILNSRYQLTSFGHFCEANDILIPILCSITSIYSFLKIEDLTVESSLRCLVVSCICAGILLLFNGIQLIGCKTGSLYFYDYCSYYIGFFLTILVMIWAMNLRYHVTLYLRIMNARNNIDPQVVQGMSRVIRGIGMAS